jgi:TRAP-type C4-dicarboxylate transport system permease small subunit
LDLVFGLTMHQIIGINIVHQLLKPTMRKALEKMVKVKMVTVKILGIIWLSAISQILAKIMKVGLLIQEQPIT